MAYYYKKPYKKTFKVTWKTNKQGTSHSTYVNAFGRKVRFICYFGDGKNKKLYGNVTTKKGRKYDSSCFMGYVAEGTYKNKKGDSKNAAYWQGSIKLGGCYYRCRLYEKEFIPSEGMFSGVKCHSGYIFLTWYRKNKRKYWKRRWYRNGYYRKWSYSSNRPNVNVKVNKYKY